MIRIVGFLLILISVFGLTKGFLDIKIPELKSNINGLVTQASAAGLDPNSWESIVIQSKKELPPIYPFSTVRSIFSEAEELVQTTNDFRHNFTFDFDFESGKIETDKINQLFFFMAQSRDSLKKIEKKLNRLPGFLLEDQDYLALRQNITFLSQLTKKLEDAETFERIFKDYIQNESRVLIVLQNQNEPRSTGGFGGNLVVFDFSENEIQWDFLDIYALDRLIPKTAQSAAPQFFHGLSKIISLRDANFYPHFPDTAKKYQYFFEQLNQEVPDTVIAINQNLVRELLKATGPVRLEKWDFTLNENNFDLGLQFLVEAKVMGRYQVKQPVELFAAQVFAPEKLKNLNWQAWQDFDLPDFIAGKNFLAYSSNKKLQQLFSKWTISGELKLKQSVDNFLHIDFISVGANKSDKFVWTKVDHNSELDPNGTVLNTLKIKRTHALKPNEIEDLLGTNNLSPNIRNLLNDDLKWKLGAGQNRVVLRAFVPRHASLFESFSPTGAINETVSEDKQFKIWEIPVSAKPGESAEVTLTYLTKIERGSHGWRPYFFQFFGTPAREKAQLLKTISTKKEGEFTAVTQNIGLPQSLQDQDFRTVIEFPVIP